MRTMLGSILVLTALLAPAAAQAQAGGVKGNEKAKEKETLLRLLDDTQALAHWMPNESAFLAVLNQVHEQISAAEESELAPMHEFEPYFSHLQAALARIRARMDSVQAATELCDPARRGELFLLLLDTLDAEGQRGVAAKIYEKLASLDGAPESLSRVRVASDLAFSSAKSMRDLVVLCDPTLDRGNAADAAHLDQLRSDLVGMNAGVQESVKTAKRDLTQAMTIVAGHVSEVTVANTSSLQGTIRAGRDQTLRLQIESALEAGKPYGVLYLPQAYGGQLETVRKILLETIQNVVASGETQNGASDKLAAGDGQFRNGHYKKAFRLYSEAYVAAVGSAAEMP